MTLQDFTLFSVNIREVNFMNSAELVCPSLNVTMNFRLETGKKLERDWFVRYLTTLLRRQLAT
jgi:hypothetical protein